MHLYSVLQTFILTPFAFFNIYAIGLGPILYKASPALHRAELVHVTVKWELSEYFSCLYTKRVELCTMPQSVFCCISFDRNATGQVSFS